MQPLISVIMPVYNGTATLDRALRSVRAQTFSNWELVAADDASTDGSFNLLQQWAAMDARIRPVRLDQNRGPAAARNAALGIARGEWVTYLDHDDEYAAGYLRHVADRRDEADVLVFGYDLLYEDGPPQGRPASWDPGKVRERLFVTNIVTPLGVAHHRAWWEKAGRFDESVWYRDSRWYEEDWDFWKRLARAGANFVYLPLKSGRYHVRADSLSRTVRERPEAYPPDPAGAPPPEVFGNILSQGEAGKPAERPLISVIMPVHNGRATLERPLRSLMEQTFSSWELVAVDDGSTDETYSILQRWAASDPRIHAVRLEENQGPGAARNAGLRIARGEWVTYLDHDDAFCPDHLGHVAGYRDPCGVLVFSYDIVMPDGVRTITWNPAEGWEEIFSTHLAMPMAIVHRRELIEKVGGFNELLWWEEDAEFLRRLLRAGTKIQFLPYRSGQYHVRADSRRRRPRLTARQKETLHGNWRGGKPFYGDPLFATARRNIHRIAFASPYCLIDHTSGAAIATASGLRFLKQLGFDCRAFCGSYMDAPQDGALEEMLAGPHGGHETQVVQCGQHQARLVHTRLGEIPVTIFRSVSTRGTWQDEAEVALFFATYKLFLDEYRPDAIWTYGGDAAADRLIKVAKNRDIPVVFGLHNFGYWDILNFAPVDYVTVPSDFSRRHHWAKLGLACHTLPNAIDWKRVDVASREPRYVTFVNPQTTKGLFVFARIAEVLACRRPDIPLLVVEGRSQTDWRQATGIDLGRLPNVNVMPHTGDPRQFYAVTKLILMPSLWNESFGLVAAEAMINGIPVLASNRGALPETIGDAGFLFDIPACYTPETQLLPTLEEVGPWTEAIARLWDDAEFYRQSGERARRHAEQWRPERLADAYRDFFGNLVPQPGPPVVAKEVSQRTTEAS